MNHSFKNFTIDHVKNFLVDNVLTSDEDETLFSITEIMKKQNVGSVIILDKQKNIFGIFTERDVLKKIVGMSTDELKKLKIKDYMTMNPKTVLPSQRLDYCIGLLRMGNFRHLVVVDEKKALLGVISMRDLFYFCSDLLAKK